MVDGEEERRREERGLGEQEGERAGGFIIKGVWEKVDLLSQH